MFLKPQIHLVPVYGLCNRMRAMASGLSIAKRAGATLKIYWENNEQLGCGFADLFQPIVGAKLIELQNPPFVYRPGYKWDLYLPRLFRGLFKSQVWDEYKAERLMDEGFDLVAFLKRKQWLVLKSYNILEKEKVDFSCFVPVPEVEKSISQISRSFTSNTIGVHIRRTDHKQAIASSPLELFIEYMQKEIERDGQVNFYLATDDAETKQKLIEQFGKRIIISTITHLNRKSKLGMQQAVVELYCLSKTARILGSYWSSYSQVAAGIHRIPLQIIKKAK